MEKTVEVRDLVVRRGRREVLHGISVAVPPGCVTGLLGPSGSGKTTLMRCLVGVQKFQSGTVTVLGRPAGTPELRHAVGYLTQSPSIYADLTVRENARYFASLYSLSNAEADRAVHDVGLADAAHQLVSTLSGGQHSRASLACALLGSPRLLVLDEPTVGQDPVLRDDLWRQFHELAKAGTTLLVSSHVMDEAARCDRLLLIRDGDLIADDTPDAIRTATGTSDLEEAFLRLIRAREAGSGKAQPTQEGKAQPTQERSS
ncbi:MAG: ABC transporter ATP-binding protein [Micromonosporaceae bacterium]|nr:ABC transporter ATP-binding protein [Micromonosporaceae bacterium]